MIPIRVDAPTVEPVSLSEMRLYLRLDPDDGGAEDALVLGLIAAARAEVEIMSRRLLTPGRYRLMLTAWPGDRIVPLPLSPVVALVRAGLVGADGIVTDLAPGLIRLGPDPVEAPSLAVDPAVPPLDWKVALVEVQAGHGGDGPPAPPALLQAIRQIVAARFDHRGDEPGAPSPDVAALVGPLRRLRL